MARYIDADKVMEEIARIGGHNFCKWHTIGVKALIDRQTTADVAPRSEVAREIFGEIEKEIESALGRIHFADPLEIPSGLPREKHLACREGKTKTLYNMERFIAELKKKYTEEQK